MKDIVPIHDEVAHAAAVAEVRRLWGAEPGTKESDRLEVLMVLVDDYETRHHAIALPDPIEAIQVRMQEMGLDRAGLGEMLGIPSGRVSEILNRRRRLTLGMIRTLSSELHLSERCLIQPYELAAPSPDERGRKHTGKVAA
jgi:HTH-type transcriptional regulator/antitoxin HigA